MQVPGRHAVTSGIQELRDALRNPANAQGGAALVPVGESSCLHSPSFAHSGFSFLILIARFVILEM
jgi:hypothetical protein